MTHSKDHFPTVDDPSIVVRVERIAHLTATHLWALATELAGQAAEQAAQLSVEGAPDKAAHHRQRAQADADFLLRIAGNLDAAAKWEGPPFMTIRDLYARTLDVMLTRGGDEAEGRVPIRGVLEVTMDTAAGAADVRVDAADLSFIQMDLTACAALAMTEANIALILGQSGLGIRKGAVTDESPLEERLRLADRLRGQLLRRLDTMEGVSYEKLPSLRAELYFAGLEGRPIDVALVRRWARQAGFVVREQPGGLFTLFDVGGLEAVDREGSDAPVEGVVQFDTKRPDGVTLDEIAVYVIDYLRRER